jgi:hypothetical protein
MSVTISQSVRLSLYAGHLGPIVQVHVDNKLLCNLGNNLYAGHLGHIRQLHGDGNVVGASAEQVHCRK